MPTFKEMKERIDIRIILTDLGYRLDPSKGMTQPCYVLTDTRKNEMDKLYIKNPNNIGNQRFWRRTISGRGGGGDVIEFIEENIDKFNMAHGARNIVDAKNIVLRHYSNMPEDEREEYKKMMEQFKPSENHVFRLERYDRKPGDVDTLVSFLKLRGMNSRTAELFAPTVDSIRDTQSQFKYRNLAFPYTQAGVAYRMDKPNDIVGYEIRGYGGFKSKAPGTNSTTACWQAYVGRTPNAIINELHFAESAYDIMAYVQINRNELNLDNSLFISVGGSFTPDIIRSILNAYPQAKPILHFDNDLSGFIYDCRFAALMCNKQMSCILKDDKVCFQVGERSFTVPMDNPTYNKFREGSGLRPVLKIDKAPIRFKDWNEILQKAMVAKPKAEKKVAMAAMKAAASEKQQVQPDTKPATEEPEPEKVRLSGQGTVQAIPTADDNENRTRGRGW